jgi:hypothetical protein
MLLLRFLEGHLRLAIFVHGCEVSPWILERYRRDGGKNMSRLEFIFKAVNAIASKKHDEVTEYMLAQAVLHEIDTAKHERRARAASAVSR